MPYSQWKIIDSVNECTLRVEAREQERLKLRERESQIERERVRESERNERETHSETERDIFTFCILSFPYRRNERTHCILISYAMRYVLIFLFRSKRANRMGALTRGGQTLSAELHCIDTIRYCGRSIE